MGAETPNPLDYLFHTKWQLLHYGWFRGLCLAGLATLSLGCMGSAVLPLAATFASTGIIVGFVTLGLVCAVNVYTSRMLLRQARATGAYDYESLGHLVGGYWWQKFVEFSNWVLLYGTIVGGMAQLAEAGTAAIQMLWCTSGNQGDWLLGPVLSDGTYTGHLLLVLYIVVLVMPWSFVKGMKQLEYAAWVGYPVVMWMTISIVVECFRKGFPAIKDGSLPALGFTSLSAVAASVSTWAFAFYIQPIMMPYYSEMPPGNVGMHATGIAVNGVLCCTALIPYVLIAFFGAALWGPAAAETGNVLENDIYGLFGPNGEVPCPNKIQGALNICVTVYLAITIPPIEFALTHIVNTWVSEIRRRFKLQKWIPKRGQGKAGWLRNITISLLNITSATGLAIASTSGQGGTNSATVLTIIGATGVLSVSYIIPIVNHFMLLSGRARVQKEWMAAKAATQLQPICEDRSVHNPPADEESADAAVDLSHLAVETRAVSLPLVGGDDEVPATSTWGSFSTSTLSIVAGSQGGLTRLSMEQLGSITAAGARTGSVTSMAGIKAALAAKEKGGKVQGRQPSVACATDSTTSSATNGHDQDPSMAALAKLSRVDPEDIKAATPMTNMFHAYKFAEPMVYRQRNSKGLRFWVIDVAVPVVVLLFGIFCSVCTLLGVAGL